MTSKPEFLAARPPADLVALEPDAWTKPFWDAAMSQTLIAQRCGNCKTFRMPPTPFCHVCRSQLTEWTTLSGLGQIYTYTVVRHAPVPALANYVPYILAMVEFDDAPGIRLMTNIVDCDPDLVRSGQKVEVVWDRVSDEATIPRFRPIS